jgi:hypothetical protein
MITLTFNSGTRKLNFYFEGNYHSQTSVPGSISLTNTSPLYIGKTLESGESDKYTGFIDELRLYTRVLRKEKIIGIHYIPGIFKSVLLIC